MNVDRLRCAIGPRIILIGPVEHQGIVWKFADPRARTAHYLVFRTCDRQFRSGRVVYNGYGTRRCVHLPSKVTNLLFSLLPDEEIARATALSLTRSRV